MVSWNYRYRDVLFVSGYIQGVYRRSKKKTQRIRKRQLSPGLELNGKINKWYPGTIIRNVVLVLGDLEGVYGRSEKNNIRTRRG